MFLPGMLLGPFPPSNIIKGVSSLTRIADGHVPNPSENAPQKSESRKSYPNRVESRTNRDRIAPTKLTRVATKLPPSAFVPSVFDSSPSLESKIPSLLSLCLHKEPICLASHLPLLPPPLSHCSSHPAFHLHPLLFHLPSSSSQPVSPTSVHQGRRAKGSNLFLRLARRGQTASAVFDGLR